MLRLLRSSTLSHNQIFVISHLSYKDAQVRAVINFKIIAIHYLKDPTGFPLDLVTVFHYMYEVIALTIPQPNIHTAVVLYLWLPHILRAAGVLLEGGEENDSFVHFFFLLLTAIRV